MIENLNLATNKEFLPGVEIPESDTYFLSPDEYNTLVLKIKELIDAHNNLTNTISGNISFMSVVFRRTNDEVVSRPTGGTFNSPVPTSTPIWSDGIPSGTEMLWASTRIFSSDGLSPQQAEWTEPSKMTDTATFDVEFSSLEYVDHDTPGNPTDNPGNWTDNGDETSIWMATAIIKNGVPPLGTDWSIVRIKGENGMDGIDGKDQEFVFTTRATPDEPYDISQLPAVQETEYIPPSQYGVWTDDPQGVQVTKQFEWVSKRTRVNSIWGQFSKPSLWARYAIDGDGQSSFKSFVFKRSTIPLTEAPPAGNGSFTNPLPDPNDGWTDYIPSGVATLWVSSRMFSKDGFAPQEDTWSIPTILADSADLDVEFSKEIVPGNPTDNPENWSNDADEETLWMAIAKLKGGVMEGTWQIIKIKGEGGTGLSTGTVYLYKRSATMPNDTLSDLTYTFSTGLLSGTDFQGWSQEIPSSDGNPIWIMFATVTSLELTDVITPSEWSNPVILSQDGGKAAIVYLYQRSDESPVPATPTTTCEYFFSTNTLTGTLGAWQQSVPATNGQPLWMIAATAYSSTATDIIDIDDWSDPITLLRDGEDGPGYESIFILTIDNTAPSTPASEQIDDFVPAGWSDNPQPISETNQYCWVCKRSKKTNIQTGLKEWSAFSTPVIFSKWAVNGKLVYASTGMVYYQLASEYAPAAPTASSFTFVPPTIIGLSENWEYGAPTYQAGQPYPYWYATYSATDENGDGIGEITFGPVTKAINFTGLVTFTDTDTITNGTDVLSFGVNGATTIKGDNIRTGTIGATTYGGLEAGGTGFTNSGMIIDLDNQTIHASKFQITADGLIKIKGQHDFTGGTLVGAVLQSTNYVAGDLGFTSAGTYINLTNGSFAAKNFKIDSEGSATFKGTIEGSTIQTAASGRRIVLQKNDISYNIYDITWYNTDNSSVIKIGMENYEDTYGERLEMHSMFSSSLWSHLSGGGLKVYNSTLHSTISADNIESPAFYQTSDERKKQNISTIRYNTIDLAKQIELKQFTFISDETDRLRYGVIAQQVETLLPSLVSTDSDGNKSVDYNSILILKIASLEERVKYLETLIK